MKGIEDILNSFEIQEKPPQIVLGYEHRLLMLTQFMKYYFTKVAKSNHKFTYNENNKQVIDLVLMYFAGHPGFYDMKKTNDVLPDYSLEKSLILVGPYGCGKSDLMICMMKGIAEFVKSDVVYKDYWKNINFQIDFCCEFDTRFSVEGYAMIKKFENIRANFLIDDIGIEKGSSNFANKDVFIASDVLLKRYNMTKFTDVKTHYTTNFKLLKTPSYPSIEETYGKAQSDRIYETHNIFTYPETAKSFRRK